MRLEHWQKERPDVNDFNPGCTEAEVWKPFVTATEQLNIVSHIIAHDIGHKMPLVHMITQQLSHRVEKGAVINMAEKIYLE